MGAWNKVTSFFGKLESDLDKKQNLTTAPNKQSAQFNQTISINRLETSPVPVGTS